MLFNSYTFIFLFLPLTLAGFLLLLHRVGREPALVWLVLASLFFYGWWNPRFLLLILLSMAFNFAVGRLLGNPAGGASHRLRRRLYLAFGIGVNLALLGYFKYAGFFLENINRLFGTELSFGSIVLPLAISFFTFQQIAYLADVYKGTAREYDFLHYVLFVSFFPHLIAGPIVHHKELLPQFTELSRSRDVSRDFAIGLTIFSIGLFKKAVIADGVAQYASPVFLDAANGRAVEFFTAWSGALAYTLQLYFDFSGYSDMAIGGARFFGIQFPINFYSPYKSLSIAEFWGRWHMTLSRFLRDYIYVPLGGNRRGPFRRYVNLMTVMLLGGLWHGAGWTFVIWGGLHGSYLVINHLWRHVKSKAGWNLHSDRPVNKIAAWSLTFLAVIVGWVFFRSESLGGARTLLEGMAGLHGFALPNSVGGRLGAFGEQLQNIGMRFHPGSGAAFIGAWVWIGLLLLVVLLFPNTEQFMERYQSAFNRHREAGREPVSSSGRSVNRLRWQPSIAWGLFVGSMSIVGLLALARVSEFIYFRF